MCNLYGWIAISVEQFFFLVFNEVFFNEKLLLLFCALLKGVNSFSLKIMKECRMSNAEWWVPNAKDPMLWIQIESFAYFSIKIYSNICTKYRNGVGEHIVHGTLCVYAFDAMGPNLRHLSKMSINLNYYSIGDDDENRNIFQFCKYYALKHRCCDIQWIEETPAPRPSK